MNNPINKKQKPPNPREKANIFSALTFSWLLGTFMKGFKRDLEVEDLYEPLKEHRSDILGDKFERVWQKELLKAKKKGRKPNFLTVIIKIFFWKNILYSVILAVTELCVRIVQPFLIGLLVRYFSISNKSLPPPTGDDPTYLKRCLEILGEPKSQIQSSEAIFFATGIVLISFIGVLVIHPYMMAVLHQGMKIRVACCSIIYRKALRLSKRALRETTAGQVVNLLSNDVNRFDVALIFLHYLWIGPVETVIVCYFMYEVVGWSTFLGVTFLLMLIPFQGFLGKKMSIYRLRTAFRTDERVRLMNEIINGIQVIKMYTWELPFAKLVAKSREKEIKEISKSAYVRGMLLSFLIFSTRFSLFITIITYALVDYGSITAEKIFVLTGFYNILRQTMTAFFPTGIGQVAEALISVKRIQAFLLYEENTISIKSVKEDSLTETGENKPPPPAIKFVDFTARWIPDQTEPTLNKINLTIPKETFLAVIGPVGSGKSSFVQAILQELPPESGSVTVNGLISYSSQEPWLFVGSIRQNILFGLAYEKQRYQKVIQVCALKKDIDSFPYGDKTIIGEKGVSLSGGQRARVNLARAIYKEADIYLLDDPLSAVDSHVGKHLFDDCVVDFLKTKTVILVTHQLQYLRNANRIIIFSNGNIQAEGSFNELQKSGLDFAKLLKQPEKKISIQEASSIVLNRRTSVSSVTSIVSEDGRDAELEQEIKEQKTKRTMSFKFYFAYFAAVKNWCLVVLMAFFFILTQVVSSAGDYWCSKWAIDEEKNANKPDDVRKESTLENIYIYSGMSIATIVVTVARSYLFFYVCMLASKHLHDNMFSNIICAPMRFFHTNPSGRILNRFSKDVGSVDEILPSTMIDCFQIFLALFGIVVVVTVVNPTLLAPTSIIGLCFYFIRVFYIKTSRSIKGLEAITRTPVFSHLNASLQGLETIRAFHAQEELIKEFDNHQDLHSSSWFIFISSSRAFGFWLDVFCVVYIAVVTFTFLFWDLTNGAEAGLAITQSLALTGMFQWGMRQSAELENYMTSVERILQYSALEKEPPLESKPNKKPPPMWPFRGEITFDKTYLRYDPNGLPVLHGISLHVYPQEKIGIVGRTGAGKSTLISALFRLAYVEGSIVIDSVETSEIGLHDLRSKISIIPQEPVLFSGTLRYNLDPFDEYPDWILWQALEGVELKEVIEENDGLNSKISEGGTNFSVGQRQLFCLARAIIRNNKILIMDEATANVDPQTDKLIQKTIRKKFRNCTVLTIAHRLNTVMDSDRILVVDAGRIVEFDHPHILLKNSNGYLTKMVVQSGDDSAKKLKAMAKKSYTFKLKREAAYKIIEESSVYDDTDASDSSGPELPSTSKRTDKKPL